MPTLYQEEKNNRLEFFICIFFGLLILIVSFSPQAKERMIHITPFELFLLSLATFRLTRLLVYDGIMQFLRDLFVQKKEVRKQGEVEIKREKLPVGLPKVLSDLLSCPWCTGMWMSFFILSLFIFWPQSYFFIVVLALAGLSTLIQIIANLIGWRAEGEKIEVKNM